MDHIKIDPATGEKTCGCFKRCGGCQLRESYADQLKRKQEKSRRLLSRFGEVSPIIPMEEPYNYRSKVQTVYGLDSRGRMISGVYQSNTGGFTATDDCMLSDRRALKTEAMMRRLMRDFKLAPYDPRTGKGLIRSTLVRTSPTTGQAMLVIVALSPVLPSKKAFVSALRKALPFLTTAVLSVTEDPSVLGLGSRETVLFGPGYIEDELCGCRFRISPGSFYQVNHVQTEKLYNAAVEAAGITEGTRVIDAYCGTGTIGIICASRGARVIGAELNPAAVRDARANARLCGAKTIDFVEDDAGRFMDGLAKSGESCDVVIMDPPRAGASKQFIKSVLRLGPRRIVYVSCKPETLARDLAQLTAGGYCAASIQPVDMFPHTLSIETVVVLERV